MTIDRQGHAVSAAELDTDIQKSLLPHPKAAQPQAQEPQISHTYSSAYNAVIAAIFASKRLSKGTSSFNRDLRLTEPTMDSAGQPEKPPLCDICDQILWFQLQPEDTPATPHHKSRVELEKSAETCILCRMVLRAAISNYQHSRGVRNGKGYWRQSKVVTYHDESGSRDVTYIKDLGACLPVGNPTHGHGGVLAATGKFDEECNHLKSEEGLPELEESDISNSTNTLPVWVYGNAWAADEPKQDGSPPRMRLVGVGARFGKTASPFDAFGLELNTIHLRGSSITICTTVESSIFAHIPGRLRELQSDSETAFNRLDSWLKECSANHPLCGEPPLNPSLPTRVIDVFASGSDVALYETRGDLGRYMTLSHCWGSSSVPSATKQSIEALKKCIKISSLPKTFQDAIQITRRVGVKYLWIDCLCILQDDPLDWEREASAMAQIYRNSHLTISAATSSNSYSGCFPERQNDSYISSATRSMGYETRREATGPNSYKAEFEHSSQPGKRNRMHLFEEWLPGSSIHDPQKTQIGCFGKHFDPIANEPLSTRGWTLQERLLSPRIIHYAGDQTYFECESLLLSEDGFEFPDVRFSMNCLLYTHVNPLREPRGISFVVGKSANGPHGNREGGWHSLVEDYSRRNLTVPQDKLTAVAGVARVIAEETDDYYCAGLWASRFIEDLFWRVYLQEEYFDKETTGLCERPAKGRVIGNVVRPTEYRAPSWSWASLDAPIKFLPLSYSHLVARVIDCNTEPAGTDRFGRVSKGVLELEGPSYEVKPHTPNNRWDRHGIPVEIEMGDERGTCIGAVHLDFPDETLRFPCFALFLDPANALIIQCKDREPYTDDQGNENPNVLVPKRILSTDDVIRNLYETPKEDMEVWIKGDENSDDPEKREPQKVLVSPDTYRQIQESWNDQGQTQVFKSTNDAVRVGIGTFVKNFGKPEKSQEEGKEEPIEWDPKVHGELNPDNVLAVGGDDPWGPVRDKDPKVRVTIV